MSIDSLSEIQANGQKQNKKPEVLLMFSGGRNSFLSALRLHREGYYVTLVTFYNGCMQGMGSVRQDAMRIVKHLGEDSARFAGIYSIIVPFRKFQDPYVLDGKFCGSDCSPVAQISQLNCLACHTAMYVAGLAYCKTHGITTIADGARESQGFFVELPIMKTHYENLALSYGVKVITPVYDLVDDQERKNEITRAGLIPKTMELQCWIGRAMYKPLSTREQSPLEHYFLREIEPIFQVELDSYVDILSNGGMAGQVALDEYV